MNTDAALYAQLHKGTPGDVDFYRRACVGAERVLELAAGWGRIAGIIAADGPEVTGLELDPAMCQMGRRLHPTVRFVEGDMRTARLEERFDRILLPYNGLYALPTDEDVIACAETVAAHLTPNGYFVFDVWVADDFHEMGRQDDDERDGAAPASEGADPIEPVATVTTEGQTYDVFERTRWDRANQRLDADYVHIPKGGSGVHAIRTTVMSRYLLTSQIPKLLEAGGLSIIVTHGDWDQSVYDETCERLIITAALPTEP